MPAHASPIKINCINEGSFPQLTVGRAEGGVQYDIPTSRNAILPHYKDTFPEPGGFLLVLCILFLSSIILLILGSSFDIRRKKTEFIVSILLVLSPKSFDLKPPLPTFWSVAVL